MTKFIVFLLLVSSTSFAGSFTKEDSGRLEWNLNVKKKVGVILMSKNSSGLKYQYDALSENEQKSLSNYTFYHTSIGKLPQENVIFQNSDERSQETVIEVLKAKLANELSILNINVDSHTVEFGKMTCVETGTFKKELACMVFYKSSLSASFK